MTQTETQEKQPITLKDLAKQADIDPRLLRRLLRKKFRLSGDAKKRYEWQPGDPQIQEILEAVKASKEKVTKDKEKPAKVSTPKAEKPKSSVKPGEIDPTTGGTPIALKPKAGNVPAGAQPKTAPFPKPKNNKPVRKTAAQLKAEGVDIKPENIG